MSLIRQGSLASLANGIDQQESEFHDRLPHLKGGECFGSIKCKISYDMGSPMSLNCLDIVNFNTPKLPWIIAKIQIAKIWSSIGSYF